MPTGEPIRLADPLEGEVDLDLAGVRVEIVEFVLVQRLDTPVPNPIGELDVREVLSLRDREMPQVLGVDAVPDLRSAVIPEERPTRRDVLIRPKERIQLTRQLPFRDRKREPCLLYTSPSPRDATLSRMPSSA